MSNKFRGLSNESEIFRNFLQQGLNVSSKQYNAFTLAEVLITLGIIGVVAALTLPVLINKNQEKVLETQYAKAKTVLANGYKLMMAKTENFKVEHLPFMNDCNQFTEKACMSNEHKKVFNIVADSATSLDSDLLPTDYIIQGESEKSPFKWSEVPYIFATTDGMTYGLLPDDELTSFSVVADVNGLKKPNIVKKDLYKFRYSGNGVLSDVSFELEEVNKCTIDNVDACKTQEACEALNGTPSIDGYGGCYSVVWWGYCFADFNNPDSSYCR